MKFAGLDIVIEAELKAKTRKRMRVNIKGQSKSPTRIYSPTVNLTCELFEGSDGTLGIRTLYTYPVDHVQSVCEVLGQYEEDILEMIRNFGNEENENQGTDM